MDEVRTTRLRILAVGISAAVAAAIARAIVFQFVGPAIPFLTFFPAVIVSALWGGTLAGLLTTVGSSALAPLWMTPGGGWGDLDRLGWINLIFFTCTCALIVWSVRQAHWAKLRSIHLGCFVSSDEKKFAFEVRDFARLRPARL